MKRDYTIDDWNRAFLTIDRSLRRRKKCINKFKIDKRSKILEVGCSDGMNLEIFYSLGYKNIFGMDVSTELLSKAKKYKRICSDAYNISIRDDSFDEVYCKGILHHLRIHDVFGELTRILRPGGVIHIVEPWPTVFRKIVDFFTLYILSYFSRTFYYRKIILVFERKLYTYWLKTCKTALFKEIENHGLKIIYRHRSLFDLCISIQKRG